MINQSGGEHVQYFYSDQGQQLRFWSGLGGNSIRDQEVTGPWIAKIYANPGTAREIHEKHDSN